MSRCSLAALALISAGSTAVAGVDPVMTVLDRSAPTDRASESVRSSERGAPTCEYCVIELYVVIDNAMTVMMGGASSAEYINDIVDAADAIMGKPQSEGGLGIDIDISGGIEFAGPQPWTHTTNPIALLGNFQGWSSGAIPVPDEDRDIVVLISGDTFDGGVIGMSFPNAVCTSNGIALLSAFTMDTDAMGTLLAHQLGHILGAGHDSVDNTCDLGFVMSPIFNPLAPATEFSDCSIDEINAFLASGSSCLAPEPCSMADLAEPYTQLDFSDVVAFLGAFSAMDPAADLANPFGFYDFSDVAFFLTAFGAGCP